jgi:stage V sporulation protein S
MSVNSSQPLTDLDVTRAALPPLRPREVLKVSTRSRPSAVAGAIAGVLREHGHAEIQSIGAGATNQAVKAIAIARSYLAGDGMDLVCVPSFIDIAIDSEERTALRIAIERR